MSMENRSAEPHDYLSTACLHDRHDECRRTCKFCEVACKCRCEHRGAEVHPGKSSVPSHGGAEIGAGAENTAQVVPMPPNSAPEPRNHRGRLSS